MAQVQARSYAQDQVFTAAQSFFVSEGILPAPESAHAIAAVIEEALRARDRKGEPVILFNLSGHGHFDMHAYERNGQVAASR